VGNIEYNSPGKKKKRKRGEKREKNLKYLYKLKGRN